VLFSVCGELGGDCGLGPRDDFRVDPDAKAMAALFGVIVLFEGLEPFSDVGVTEGFEGLVTRMGGGGIADEED
jgi:hypothetical protein